MLNKENYILLNIDFLFVEKEVEELLFIIKNIYNDLEIEVNIDFMVIIEY